MVNNIEIVGIDRKEYGEHWQRALSRYVHGQKRKGRMIDQCVVIMQLTHEVRRSPGPGTLSRERHHEWIRKAEETWEGYLMKRKSGTGSRSSTDGGMSHRVC
jgi:hypothetical protein